MKFNSFLNSSILFSIMLLFVVTSCKVEEENIFENSAAVRLNSAKSEYNKILCAAPNGWVMQYFPNEDSKGYTFLMKFNTSGAVTIAAKNDQIGDVYKTETSMFEIIGDNGPVLTFNTYNTLFHLFSTPELDPVGYGLHGDYEFIVLNADSGEVNLKSKKYGVYVTLKRMANDQDWPKYYEILSSTNKIMFGNSLSVLRLKLNDSTFYSVKNGSTQIFTLIPNGGDETTDAITKPFIVTENGIRLVTPLKLGNVSVRDFILSDDKNELISTEKGVNAKIVSMSSADVFMNLMNARVYMNMVSSEEQMSSSVKSLYDNINSVALGKGRKLEYIGFTNNKTYGLSLSVYTTKGTSKVEGFISYAIEKIDESTIRLKFNGFTGKYDTNGKTYYDSYGLSAMVAALDGDYQVSIRDGALSASVVRFTNVTDSSKWFDLKLK